MKVMRVYPAKPADVYLYATCLVDLFEPQAGVDAITLLEREGVNVHFVPKQTCCGQPAYTSGYEDEARAVATSQMALFPEPWPVVVLSGSCGGMMHHHYRRLFPDSGAVAAFCDRVFELTEFLVNVCRVRWFGVGEARIVMHTACSARREMQVHTTARSLLEQLAGVTLLEQAEESECCGFGGTFSVRHPAISEAMVEDKVRHLQNTGAEMLVSADWGCLLNIKGALAYQGKVLPAQHLASFLLAHSQRQESVPKESEQSNPVLTHHKEGGKDEYTG
ncbi:(Fe-S)-binding protein [Serratia sp. DD3]|uniref:(Fe-S)-binding protein n=1 Tax=Serratia sp. DD3 TaxID=1410619 RepID=UPI0003C513BD|nr:(Fe-S)-binding protein [Serratia sp. DD3]KEY59965.1 lactate utilization protein A [Serratia sp. DD3]